jgi:hypothetical protein
MRIKLLLDPDPSLLGGAGGGGTPPPGGGGTGSWLDTLPQDIRSSPSLIKYKSIEELAKGHINAESLIGKKRIAAPDQSWKDTDWEEFYKSVGRPETPDGYKLPELKLPEGLKADGAKVKKAREAFHKAGLTGRQFEAAMGLYAEELSTAHEAERVARETAISEGTNALKQKWGDKFDANLDVARNVLKKFGSSGLLKQIEDSGFGNNPEFIASLHAIGSAILDDRARGQGGGDLDIMDSTRATREIETLKMDAGFQKILNDPKDPGHKAAVERWMSLFSKAHPGKQD